MTDKLFYKLWQDALSQPDEDMYIAEFGWPEYFDEIGDTDEVIRTLRDIHRIAHMRFKEILQTAELTQQEFAEKFCIPKRTVENWSIKGENGRKCPDWLRLMFCKQLGIYKPEGIADEKN